MGKYFYDLHIHSVLSPCGDDDMTPCNIVGMSKRLGLDVIAITDHNSTGNAEAVMKCGQAMGLTVVPGMELETREEVHVLMLFEDLSKANEFSDFVMEKLFKIKNDVSIYGKQQYMNEDDEEVGTEENLLVVSVDIGVYDVVALADKFGGVAIPAHIDKASHSVLAMLGDIDEYMGFKTLEVSCHATEEFIKSWQDKGYRIIRDSDSHYLDSLNERVNNALELDEPTAKCLVRTLRS